jgi:hypothetical protein
MRYFWKGLISNTISAAGKTIQFDPVGAGRGVIATEDPGVIALLDHKAKNRQGGIRELTLEEYTEEVKKKSGTSLPPKPQERQAIQAEVFGSNLSPSLLAAEAEAAAEPKPNVEEQKQPLQPEVLPVSGPTVAKIGRR